MCRSLLRTQSSVFLMEDILRNLLYRVDEGLYFYPVSECGDCGLGSACAEEEVETFAVAEFAYLLDGQSGNAVFCACCGVVVGHTFFSRVRVVENRIKLISYAAIHHKHSKVFILNSFYRYAHDCSSIIYLRSLVVQWITSGGGRLLVVGVSGLISGGVCGWVMVGVVHGCAPAY